MKAISLYSGGLDSILATRLMVELGIEVEAFHYKTVFDILYGTDDHGAVECSARALGVPLKVFDVSEAFLSVVKDPEQGYGSNLNPCIDCRIFMLRQAKAHMEASGARFIVTGEVVGERPMSQHKNALRHIEKEAGLEGYLLRPLSARILPPTGPETEGWVDRDRLKAFQGRGRRPQIELAAAFGIDTYPTPAGGCLLTDPLYSARLKDLMEHKPAFTVNDAWLLRTGRHFRLSPGVTLVVGRREDENGRLEILAGEGDLLLKLASDPGPVGLLRGKNIEDEIGRAAAITLRYSRFKETRKADMLLRRGGVSEPRTMTVSPVSEEEISGLMIGR
jgi:tRNA-specific 2-thiouridylase